MNGTCQRCRAYTTLIHRGDICHYCKDECDADERALDAVPEDFLIKCMKSLVDKIFK